jgi:hypothetical protein
MGKNSIPLHREFGLNPTIAVSHCPLCGKKQDEGILLPGAKCKEKAPMYTEVPGKPCDNCKEMMKQGVVIVSVRDGTDHDNPYRTGRIFCVREEAVKKMLGEIPAKRACFIEDSALDKMGFPPLKKLQQHPKEEEAARS